MFQSKKASPLAATCVLLLLPIAATLSSCGSDSSTEPAPAPSRSELFADPLGTHTPATPTPRPVPAPTVTSASSSAPVTLRGRVVDARSQRPEVNCLVSIDGQDTYSDERGDFFLEGLTPGSEHRVRFRCRGLIERHQLRVPEGEGIAELEAPIVVGRSLEGTRGSASRDARGTFREAIRDLDNRPEPTSAQTSNASAANATPTPEPTPPPSTEGAPENGAGACAAPQTSETSPTTAETALAGAAATAPSAQSTAETTSGRRARLEVKAEQLVEGTLSHTDLSAELRRRVTALQSCYAGVLETTSRDRVHATRVRWTVQPDGSVQDAQVLDATIRNEEMTQCVVRRVARLQFPASAGTTEVTQTFIFGFRLDPMAQIP